MLEHRLGIASDAELEQARSEELRRQATTGQREGEIGSELLRIRGERKAAKKCADPLKHRRSRWAETTIIGRRAEVLVERARFREAKHAHSSDVFVVERGRRQRNPRVAASGLRTPGCRCPGPAGPSQWLRRAVQSATDRPSIHLPAQHLQRGGERQRRPRQQDHVEVVLNRVVGILRGGYGVLVR